MATAAVSSRARCLLAFRRRAPLPLPLPLPPFPSPIARAATRRRGVRMASSEASASAPPSTTIEVPGAAAPVLVVGAPGLPEADFRSASGFLLRFHTLVGWRESSLIVSCCMVATRRAGTRWIPRFSSSG